MDLASFAGADYLDITLAGVTYRVGELSLREWAPVQAWIKASVPGPLSSLASPDFRTLPPDIKREVLGEALEQDRTSWPPAVGRKPWFLALDHPGGHAVLLKALLSKHRPTTTLEECEGIAEAVSLADILPAVLAGLGLTGPKSPAPEGPTTTAAGARTTSKTSRGSSSKRTGGRRTTS